MAEIAGAAVFGFWIPVMGQLDFGGRCFIGGKEHEGETAGVVFHAPDFLQPQSLAVKPE